MEIDPIHRARRAVKILRAELAAHEVPASLSRCQRVVAVVFGCTHWYALARQLRQTHVEDPSVVATRRERLEVLIRAAFPPVAANAAAIAGTVFPASRITLRPAMPSQGAMSIAVYARRIGDAVAIALCERQGTERSTFYIMACPGRLRFYAVGGSFDDEEQAFSAVDLAEGSQDYFTDDGRVLGCLLLGPETMHRAWARDPRDPDEETAWRRMSHARDALLAALDEPALEILSACEGIRDVEAAYAYYVKPGEAGRLRRDLARRHPWLAAHVVPEREQTDEADPAVVPSGPDGSFERALGLLVGLTEAQAEHVASRLGDFDWRAREREVLVIAMRTLAAVGDNEVPNSAVEVRALLSLCRHVHSAGFDYRSAEPDAAVRILLSIATIATAPWAKVEERWHAAVRKATGHIESRGIDAPDNLYQTLEEIIAAVAWRVVRPALIMTGADPYRARRRDARGSRPVRIPPERFERAVAHLVLDDFDIRYGATTVERWSVWRAEVDRGDEVEGPPTTTDLERVLDKLRPFLGPRHRAITLDDLLRAWERNMSAQGFALTVGHAGPTLPKPPSDEAASRRRSLERDEAAGKGAMASTTFYRANIGPAMFEARLGARGLYVVRVDGAGSGKLPLATSVVVWCQGSGGRNGWQACDRRRSRPRIDLSDLNADQIREFGRRFSAPIQTLPPCPFNQVFKSTPAEAGLRRFVRDHAAVAARFADADPHLAGWL